MQTISSAFDLLARARRIGVKLGLDAMRLLNRELGSPDSSLRFIHLAGTNGKGSTAAFVASMLQHAGYRVALYTSPHLHSVRERIQLNNEPISREDFARHVHRVDRVCKQTAIEPSFFELLTAVALDYFAQQRVDWVVWETGMGGRLDATNIVTPAISIITHVGLDHTAQLGTTLAAIAGEKAGIIKPGIPVVMGHLAPDAATVIGRVAHERNSRLLSPSAEMLAQLTALEPEFQLRGPHQIHNAACALTAVEAILTPPAPPDVLLKGLKQASWRGRFEILRNDPPFVLDGAHNAEGAAVLRQTWESLYPGVRFHLIFSSAADKPHAEMMKHLLPLASRITLVPLASERSFAPDALKRALNLDWCHLAPDLASLWAELGEGSDPVLVTGSLFLVGQALALYEPDLYPPDELDLNERLK